MEILTFISVVLSIILIITFFVMAKRLSDILDLLRNIAELMTKNPSNRKPVKCVKCQHDFTVSNLKKGNVDCPSCKSKTPVD